MELSSAGVKKWNSMAAYVYTTTSIRICTIVHVHGRIYYIYHYSMWKVSTVHRDLISEHAAGYQ